jgi:hypothetical protein
MQSKLISEQEKTLKEFADTHKAFYEQFTKEDVVDKLKREVKQRKAFGNKDKSFKKQLADKWEDPRLQ